MTTFLAVDIGASGGRHIVGWLENGRLETREAHRFPNGARRVNGHLCWDAEELVRQVIIGLKKARDMGYTPVSMGIDTWAVDFALLDKRGGMVGDMTAYRDERTKGMDAQLESELPFERHYAVTGIARQPFNTVYQMMAVLREHPEYRDIVTDFLLVPEYISYRLTGRRAHEWTNVSATALADARAHGWAREVIKKAGLPERWFQTPILRPGSALGTLLPDIRDAVGFDTAVLLPATHDTGSAFMAVPALGDSSAFLSSGTWSLLGTELSEPVTGEAGMRAGFTNEGGWDYTTRYLKNIMGMWMLQCLRAEAGDRHTYAEMADMAAASAYPAHIDASDARFLAPVSMTREVEAALRESGAPAPGGFADLARAVTVGLAASYRSGIREMSALTGKAFTSVNIVGGGSRNAALNQLTADMTGLTVYAGPTEGTAIGNLAAQMISGGALASLCEARRVIADSFEIRRYRPE